MRPSIGLRVREQVGSGPNLSISEVYVTNIFEAGPAHAAGIMVW